MASVIKFLFCLTAYLPFLVLLCQAEQDPRLAYEEGYYKREHSLVQPYQGQGMEVPNWDFSGATVVTNQYVRLTPDRQSKRGAIWNRLVSIQTCCLPFSTSSSPSSSSSSSPSLLLSLACPKPQLGAGASFCSAWLREALIWRWICILVHQGKE